MRYEKYTAGEALADLGDSGVQVIGAKAFLSCREVEKLILPDSLLQVEDWAFAHMKNLTEIVLPPKDLLWGKQVFLGCDSLQKVTLSGVCMLPGLDLFLACVFRYFPERPLNFLASLTDTAGQESWLLQYDRMLTEFLASPDDTGFVPAFIGWFDVEDVDDQKEGFIQKRKLEKLSLTINRLENARNLKDDTRKLLNTYLNSLAPSVIQMLQNGSFPKQNSIAFYRIWHEAESLDTDTAAKLLTFDTITDAEVRNYLIELTLTGNGGDGFFSGLDF